MHVNICPPFLHGTKVTARRPGQLEMTVIVRGVFRLAPGEPVAPIEDYAEKGLSGDLFAEGDDDRTGALVHASDFGDFKLKTDVLVRGTCYPGGGRTAQVCNVRFAVGAWSKSLRVFGRRMWTERAGEPISEPAPFASMPITYESAFGGPEYPKNPVGKGYRTPELPTVEDPSALVRSRRDTPEPAGFGPISPSWPQRSGKVGADYGKTWKKTRAPFYAADFDWSHWNAAPADQQLDGYLRGDEKLVFEYLHPRAIRIEASLPGIRPRVVCRRTDGFTTEVPMNLDTLVADLDRERLVLLWRGLAKVTDDQLDDVRTLFLGCEPLAEPRPAEHYLAELEAFDKDPLGYLRDSVLPPEAKKRMEEGKAMRVKLKAEAEARAKEPPPPNDPIAFLESVFAAQKDVPPEQATRNKAAMEKLRGFLQENMGKRAELLEKSGATPTQDGAEALMAQGLAKAKALAASKGMPTDRIDAAEKELARGREARIAAQAKRAAGSGPTLGGTSDGVAGASPEVGVKLPEVEPGAGADLMGRDLSGRDLRGLDLRGAKLRDAKLVKANLAGANLTGADLSKADLEGADLTGADLTQATFIDAKAPGAVFDGATLARTILANTDLGGASFVDARGIMTIFQSARMGAAKLGGARFHKAFFGQANLEGADFTAAELDICSFLEVNAAGARFDRAQMTKTCFLRSRMSGASFVEASGEGCSWHGTTADEADFSFAKLRRSQFNKASLDRAKLYASDFKGSRFERASLAGAGFAKANLMSVSFNKAKLAATDFSGASLYDAKFLGTVATTKCDFDGANLKLAIWEQP